MRLRTATLAAMAAGAGAFTWGLAEAAWFTVRQVTVPVLPPDSRPIRVLHMADIHLLSRQSIKLDFIGSWAELQPDLIVNTGDNISEASAIPVLVHALAELKDVPGVFVFGSNDYFAPRFRNPLTYLINGPSEADENANELPWPDLQAAFTQFGWKDLNNQSAELNVQGTQIAFRGTDDAHHQRDRYGDVAGPGPQADLKIGVTHAPYARVLDAMTSDGVDIIFAGHTHGGQVQVPGFGALVTNCDLDRARVKGLSSHHTGERKAHLHVSGGVGTSPFAPYRFANRPEVTVLTLTSRG